VLDFVRSRDALANLQYKVDVRRRYANGGDVLSRFPSAFAGILEDLYKYYSKMIDANINTQTGTAVIKVKAFTSNDAYQINQALLGMSEDMINRLNARAQERGIAEAEHQVAIATERARKITAQLTAYRNQSALIDPGKQAVGVIDIANQMVSQRAALQAQLEAMQRETPRNPAIPALILRVAAISRQIAKQNDQVVGGSSTIAQSWAITRICWSRRNSPMKTSRPTRPGPAYDAQKQQFYLERVVEPNRPDAALLPHRLLSVLMVGASALCLYFIGWMLMIGILEHAPEK
jgi:capsular polysaccharide transport system permease protein